MKEFLSRSGLMLIIFTYLGIIISLSEHLTPFLLIFGLLCSGWRSANFYGRLPMLPVLWLTLVTIGSSLATIALVYQQGLFNSMLHLIALGFSLKFLELKSIRDVHFFVNTGFVLVALLFVFNYSIAMALIAALFTLLLLSILLSVHGGPLIPRTFTSLLFKSCLMSLPLALILFVVLPRFPTLWKMPTQKQAITGLSDTVTPGEIAKLSRSSELAFRATFSGDLVSQDERYWRAMTLDNFDGRTWSQSPNQKEQERNVRRSQGTNLSVSTIKNSYEMIIEPHFNYWIPALDYSKADLSQVNLSDYSLRSTTPILKRRSVNVNLYQSVNTPPLTEEQQLQLTKLPEQGNLKTQQWVTDKLQQGIDKKDILTQLLKQFNTDNFRYTLNPPLLGRDQVDDFLFSTQAGFCVHYASSYLYVARLVAIPARMVTGYLGGEWQADDQFMSVRQYDAHAWVEIWQEDRWMRVDPTAYVAPERVESGLEAGLSDSNEFLEDEFLSLQKWKSIKLLNQLRQKMAQIDYLWSIWVVNYDNKKQLALMQAWLSKVPWINLFSAILTIMLLAFFVTVLLIFKPWQRIKYSEEDRLYLKLQRHFAKHGINKEKGQTVSEFCIQASLQSTLPESQFNNFAGKYNSLKYNTALSASERKKQLKQLAFVYKQLCKNIHSKHSS